MLKYPNMEVFLKQTGTRYEMEELWFSKFFADRILVAQGVKVKG
jgi:hypothetical protein